MPKTLSVAIITRNEAANLPRTLASVRWANEIVVVDSGSTDATLDLAREAGARVFEESWKGFAAQKNSAIAHATGDWILSLDADEEVSPQLAQEIQALLAGEPASSAYRIPRLNHFLGCPLRHGGYWPDPKLRLFRRGAAQFADRPVHESMQMMESRRALGPAPRPYHPPLLPHALRLRRAHEPLQLDRRRGSSPQAAPARPGPGSSGMRSSTPPRPSSITMFSGSVFSMAARDFSSMSTTRSTSTGSSPRPSRPRANRRRPCPDRQI